MPENIDSYDILSKYYSFIYNHQVFDKDNVKVYLDKLVDHVENKNRFLDIGCGTGIFTEKLFNFFNTTYGIDPSSAMLKNCVENSKIKYFDWV